MKQTFIFHLNDGVTGDQMNALSKAVDPYPSKVDYTGGYLYPARRVEVTIEPREMDTIARFIGISQVALHRALQRPSGTVEVETVTRAQFNDTLHAIRALLEMRQVSAAQRVIASALHEPYKLGSPQLTSALKTLKKPMARAGVTRRSKRSA